MPRSLALWPGSLVHVRIDTDPAWILASLVVRNSALVSQQSATAHVDVYSLALCASTYSPKCESQTPVSKYLPKLAEGEPQPWWIPLRCAPFSLCF